MMIPKLPDVADKSVEWLYYLKLKQNKIGSKGDIQKVVLAEFRKVGHPVTCDDLLGRLPSLSRMQIKNAISRLRMNKVILPLDDTNRLFKKKYYQLCEWGKMDNAS